MAFTLMLYRCFPLFNATRLLAAGFLVIFICMNRPVYADGESMAISNNTFSQPSVPNFAPMISDWTQSGSGSGIVRVSLPAGIGPQVAYIQANDANSISQTVGAVLPGAYDLSVTLGLFKSEDGIGAANTGTLLIKLSTGQTVLAQASIKSTDLSDDLFRSFDAKVLITAHYSLIGRPLDVTLVSVGDTAGPGKYSFAVDKVTLTRMNNDPTAPLAPTPAAAGIDSPPPPLIVLSRNPYEKMVDQFNADDNELYKGAFDNAHAWRFLSSNIPLFDCPDQKMGEIYLFRWWTYRKHLRSTPDGWVVSEFLPDVPWAGPYNSIDCAAGHHIAEGRWLADPKYIDDYCKFWFTPAGQPRRYSFWAAYSVYQDALVTGEKSIAISLLDPLIANYAGWEKEKLDPNGLFWQVDDRDGMEVSIGGSGYRATVNSYMYGDATAIAQIANWAGRPDVAAEFKGKAESIKTHVLANLWDPSERFFKVLPQGTGARLATARELHGYTPWYFDLPPDSEEFSAAWAQLMDPQGFYAPFGPTTAERRSPGFALSYTGHECQWNGPTWPFATSITLTAMANLLNDYHQSSVSKADYLKTLNIYADSQFLKQDDGKVTPWIDEDLNPDTGDWIARTIQKDSGHWNPVERGKDYNHSTFCDLVITGLVGLRPRADNTLDINPLLPPGTWQWFCLDGVRYHDHTLAIVWDSTGTHYNKGTGLTVYCDGKRLAHRAGLGQILTNLPAKP